MKFITKLLLLLLLPFFVCWEKAGRRTESLIQRYLYLQRQIGKTRNHSRRVQLTRQSEEMLKAFPALKYCGEPDEIDRLRVRFLQDEIINHLNMRRYRS